MNPEEKDHLNRAIAEGLDRFGLGAYAWQEGNDRCPQGHGRLVPIEDPGRPHCVKWIKDIKWAAGALCLSCLVFDLKLYVPSDNISLYEAYDKARTLRQAHQDDPTWHPEWRIGRPPRDFTDPEHLLTVVKAWIRQRPADEDWTFQVVWYGAGAAANVYSEIDKPSHGEDPDSEWVALARAFLEVMKGEHADEKD